MLAFRNIEPSDLEKIMNWRMSANVTKYMYTDPVLTSESQKLWFEKITADPCCRYWLVSESQIDIGVVAITDITKSKCNLAWYIGEDEYRGKGLGTSILLNLFDYVFDTLKLKEIYSEALEENAAAINLYKKCGFRIMKILEDKIMKAGKQHSVVVLKITRTEWADLKDKYKYEKVSFEV